MAVVGLAVSGGITPEGFEVSPVAGLRVCCMSLPRFFRDHPANTAVVLGMAGAAEAGR